MNERKQSTTPAFPQSVAEINGGAAVSHDFQDGAGMSLRDYFAAHALTGVLANLSEMTNEARGDLGRFALDCYVMADAMLAERAKE